MPRLPDADHSPIVAPEVVGMVVDDARAVAAAARVTLAQPDPDGPPLAALTWRTGATVTGQRPAAGTVLQAWESVVVTWDDGRGEVREPRRPVPLTAPGSAEGLPNGARADHLVTGSGPGTHRHVEGGTGDVPVPPSTGGGDRSGTLERPRVGDPG